MPQHLHIGQVAEMGMDYLNRFRQFGYFDENKLQTIIAELSAPNDL
ncbi:MAG: hypothetical protein LBS25_06545 [Candidatus Symbiothrix sp.]|jgi:hypothetical protein|nr:hypothetical protein [Candidatus Symbiothrix sp.]